MSSKKHSYILAVIVTVIAGIGMLSTGIAAMATTNDVNTHTQPQPQPHYQYSNNNTNDNNNDSSNVNNNTVFVAPQPQSQLAQIPSYQYQPPYSPPPAPTYLPPAYDYYEAPGIPNTGFGDIPTVNLILMLCSGLFMLAGMAYLFSWSKQNEKFS